MLLNRCAARFVKSTIVTTTTKTTRSQIFRFQRNRFVSTSSTSPVEFEASEVGNSQVQQQMRSFYKENGYIILNNAFTRDDVQIWKSYINETCLGVGPLIDPSTGAAREFTKTGIRVWMAHETPSEFVTDLTSGSLSSSISTLLESDSEFLSVKPVVKTKAIAHESPWHQDNLYWGGSVNKISAWIAIDDAEISNGCMQIVPKSHTAPHPHIEVNVEQAFDWRVDPETLNKDLIESVPLKSGSVLLFHDMLLHSSHPNATGADRFCLIATYRTATTKDLSEVWNTTTPIAIDA